MRSMVSSVLALALLFPAKSDIPYSNNPPMSYGNNPFSTSVYSGAQFSETVWVGDKDEYDREGTGIIQICNAGVSVDHVIRSGTIVGTPSVNFDGDDCKKTVGFTITANTNDESNPVVYQDDFRGQDNQIGILHDTNNSLMTCQVTVLPPP